MWHYISTIHFMWNKCKGLYSVLVIPFSTTFFVLLFYFWKVWVLNHLIYLFILYMCVWLFWNVCWIYLYRYFFIYLFLFTMELILFHIVFESVCHNVLFSSQLFADIYLFFQFYVVFQNRRYLYMCVKMSVLFKSLLHNLLNKTKL